MKPSSCLSALAPSSSLWRLRHAAWAALLLVAVVLAGAPGAVAQDGDSPLRIGVVDLQKILRESVAAQGVRAQIEATQKKYREEIKGKEDDLRSQKEELVRQKTILAKDAYAAREAEFAKRVEALQREVAERNRRLETSLGVGMKQVQAAALKIIAELAEQRGYTLVLDKSQLLLVAKGMQFSSEVVALLNERLPAVSTEKPSETN